MSKSSNRIGTLWVAIALAASACGGYANDADTETISTDIFQGTSITSTELDQSGLVAIYHPKLPSFPNFYPRPCSGVIVTSNGGLTTILTARHCVTTDNSPFGTLVNASQLRLMRTLSPGAANPNPPAGAITPSLVIDKVGDSNDVAVVYAQVDWTSVGDNRIGLYVGDPRSLVGLSFTAYGYGINVADGSCGKDNNSSGAGVARSGASFTVTSGAVWQDGEPNSYKFGASVSSGAALYCGDSGGPDELSFPAAGRTVLGVHQEGATTVGEVASTAFDFGVQNRIGGLYLTPASQRTSDVMVGVDSSTAVLKMVGRTSFEQTTVAYDVPTKLLWISGYACASASNASPTARAVDCNAADTSQQWDVRINGQLYNAAAGKCLTAGASNLALGPCTTIFFGRILYPTASLWLFHAQP